MSANLACKYIFFICRFPYNPPKIITWTADFPSPPKEVVLRIIAPKTPSSSAEFEPANLGSNAKHDNHYTTEAEV
jgi:hypothetical protein